MLRRDLNKIKVSIKIINVVFGESPQSQTVAISLQNCSLEKNSRENNTRVLYRKRILYIENVCCLEREGALDRSAHITALNSHGAASQRWRLGRRMKCGSTWSALDPCLYARSQKRLITDSLGSSTGTLKLVSSHLRAVHSIALPRFLCLASIL